MADDNIHHELGRHEAEIDMLQNDVSEIKKDVKLILGHINKTKGGWATISIVAGVSHALGLFIASIWHKLH